MSAAAPVDQALTDQLLETLRARRQSRRAESSREPDREDRRPPYLLAASVLHVFDCATLERRHWVMIVRCQRDGAK